MWVAVKKGYNEKDAAEGVNKVTGLRKIFDWAYRNGVFERYADTPWGENFIDRKGLCLQSLGKIFDEEREEQNGSQHRTGRTVSPSSSPTTSISETQNKSDLEGHEREEYVEVYKDIRAKLSAARDNDDASSKDFYGMLMDCMQNNMITMQQWNEKKDILKSCMKEYENADDTFLRDTIYGPSFIKEAKEKLST